MLVPFADFFNHGNVNTNYFYAGDDDPSPDINAEDIESEGEDQDEEGFRENKLVGGRC